MADKHSDHNLLIGILAVQLDFITRDQLIESMMEWIVDKSRAIDDVFLTKGWIEPGTRDLILALVAKHLEQHGDDPQQSLAAVSSIDSSFKHQLQSIRDSGIEASLQALPNKDASVNSSSIGFGSTVEFGGEKGSGRYRVVRPHARGGLGEVHVAYDSELHREVALKEILEQHADQADSRARFLAEAEVTGGLEHPGIVPVYGLGTYDNGRPFYAMRFIKGDSLKTSADQFHKSREEKAKRQDFQGVEFRDLLGRFIDVCNAVEYAHSRGVLHRDLKPGNIMVGKYGETLVVDWGLSKVIGRPEIGETGEETTLRPSSFSGTAPTQMGLALGTPQYMPPEQAAGRLDQLGPESDVYSLGATLFYLLVGLPPFDKTGNEIGALLNDVQKGDFKSPAQVNGSVPPALNAICMKAMACESKHRFAAASELGKEIEKWLADEPVECYDEPWTSRVGRLIRNNQVGFVASAIILLSISVGLIVFSGLIAANNSILSQKNEEIQNQSDEIQRVNVELETLNVNLEDSLKSESRLRSESESRRILAETRWAETLYEKSQGYCKSGEPDVGLYWLVRALETAPESATGVREAIRFSMAYWQQRTLFLNFVFGHKSQVTSVKFTKDSKGLLTASFDRTARLWSLETGKPLGPPLPGTHQIEAIALLKDQRTVVIGCYDGVIRILDAITGEQKGEAKADTLVREIKVNPDETIAFARTNSGALFSFDPMTGRELEQFKNKPTKVYDFDFHPQKKQLVLARFKEKEIALWDLESQETIVEKKLPEPPRLIRFSPDGKHLVVVAGNPQILLADTLEPKSDALPQNGVHKIDFQADGNRFVTAGLDGQAIVFSCPEGKILSRSLRHPGQVFDAKLSPDGRMIITSSRGVSQLWDAATGEKLGQPLNDSGVIAFAPSNKQLVTGSYKGTVRVWSSYSPLVTAQQLDMDGYVADAKFEPQSKRFIASSDVGTARIWNIDLSQPTVLAKPLLPTIEVKNESRIGAVAIRSDGAFATGGSDKKIRLYDKDGNLQDHPPMEHDSSVETLGYSPDGKILVSGGDESVLAFWDASSGELVGEPIAMDGPARLMDVGQHGDQFGFVVAGGMHGKVVVCNLNTQELMYELIHRDEGLIRRFSISNNGQWIATGGDGILTLWDVASGTKKWEYTEFTKVIEFIDFSPDDDRLLIGGYDQVARIIDVATGKSTGISIRHESFLKEGTFALEGKVIITGERDGFSRISHAATGLVIGSLERHRGEPTYALQLKDRHFLVGHGSFRLSELRPANDPVDGLRDRIALMIGTRMADDGTESFLSAEQFAQMKESFEKMSEPYQGFFRIPSVEGPDYLKSTRVLSAMTNPISKEKGKFPESFRSFSIPKRSKSSPKK